MIAGNELLLSPIVILELEYLFEIGRLTVEARTIIAAIQLGAPLRICDLPFEEVARAASQERWTRDPFDRRGSRIRHIFLQPRPHVSIMQATGLLGWTRRRMSEAIENGEVELWTTPLGKCFPRAEMMAKALEIWPMHVIEEALGDDVDGILPQAIRSAELRVRLPRHHIDMLEYRADQQETTVSGVLARELDGIASAHIEELSAALPGFAEAMAWPGGC